MPQDYQCCGAGEWACGPGYYCCDVAMCCPISGAAASISGASEYEDTVYFEEDADGDYGDDGPYDPSYGALDDGGSCRITPPPCCLAQPLWLI